ncbi:MAG: hypothetical protein AAFP86_07910, partial [Planctomycetota bacterium]
DTMAERPGEVLAKRYALLSKSWKLAFDSKFPRKYEAFLSRLKASQIKNRQDYLREYRVAVAKIAEVTASKDTATILGLAQKFQALGEGFDSIGDKYHASSSFFNEGELRGERHHGPDADLHKVADATRKGLLLREDWELEDSFYKRSKPFYDGLRARGYGEEAKEAGEAPGAAPKAKKSVPSIAVALAVEPIDALKDTRRPSYYLDEHRQIWPTVALKGTGSTAKFLRIEDGPTIIRESSAKVVIDQDGDGTGDLEWPTRGKFEAFTVELGSGASARTWSVLTEVGRQDDFYQGQQMNLMATDDQYNLYFIPASCAVGELGGQRIEIYDDNIDGIYGSLPQAWGHAGLADGTFQPEVDSFRVAGDKRARPFSEYIEVEGAGWFKVASINGGAKLTAQPVELRTGTVQLKGKGAKPDFFILKGRGEGLDNVFIDVAGGKKVDVPAGRYELHFGMVSKGKGMQRSKAVILPGPGTPLYEVPIDGNLVVEFGQPYGFLFEYETGGGSVTVEGKSVQVVGKGGEIYDRFYNCVPVVEASVRKKGGKRAAASVSMRPVVDNQGVADHGWAAMWKPLDGTIEGRFEEVEVQLAEKKNKLFGKVTSDWK